MIRGFQDEISITLNVKPETDVVAAIMRAINFANWAAESTSMSPSMVIVLFDFSGIEISVSGESTIEDSYARYSDALAARASSQGKKFYGPEACTGDSSCPIHSYHRPGDIHYEGDIPFEGE